METPPKRLYKSRRYRVIDGVCGGIAEYFDVDPTIVRLLWVLLTLLGGSGIILYIIAMIVMPTNPELQYQQPADASSTPASTKRSDMRRFWGILLILIGAMIFMTNLGWFAAFDWWEVSWEIVFPIILILVGVWIMYAKTKKTEEPSSTTTGDIVMDTTQTTQPRMKELRRSVTDRKLFGVCGGIAKYFDVDPTIVRILYIVLSIGSLGWGLLLYIILTIIMPEEKITATTS
jgi:phage shock protein C